MPPSVGSRSVRSGSVNSEAKMTSGSFFKVRDRDELEIQEARQKASIKWLVTKAYGNRPPKEFQEPFYRDHNNKDRLKPHLVHALANAELYCMAMSHLYEDPNYNNLNHWGIIQAMSRKGVFVSEPSDCALTETVLIKNNPLKMSAHMAVIEALMLLYVRELVDPPRVQEAITRFTKTTPDAVPQEPEEALLLWVNESCQSLRKNLEESNAKNGGDTFFPKLTKLQDLSDFSDGVGMTSVIAFYCPDELMWSEIAVGDPPSMSDSLCNIQLFQRFCQDALPFNLCYLSMEDIFYLHSSIKMVLQCLLADLFTVMEVSPVKCVSLPGAKKDHIIEVPDPDRYKSPGRSNGQHGASDREEPGDGFVVQKGRSIPTLASVNSVSHRSMSPASSDLGHKERLNQDTKSEERGETETPSLNRSNSYYDRSGVAGRPSEPRSLPSKRSLSRRNSVSENFESQISIENIGGSTDNISVLGRNPDKEMKVHSGRRGDSVAGTGTLRRGSSNQQTYDIRNESLDNDAKMFLDNKDLDAMEKHEREGSPYGGKSSQYVNLNNSKDERDRKTSFADLRRKSQTQNLFATSGINITYCDGEEKEDYSPKRNTSITSRRESSGEQVNSPGGASNRSVTGAGDTEMNDKLNSVRMKLEERRKRIEEEKRKMEQVMSRQERSREKSSDPGQSPGSALTGAWLSERQQPGSPYTTLDHSRQPSVDPYHDHQQSQIQRMMGATPQPYVQSPPAQPHNPMDPQPFYITGDSPHHPPHQPPPPQHQRRTWGQPQPINFAGNGNMYGPRPMYGQGQYGAPAQYDQYGQPIVPRDQWGNPLPPHQYPGQYPDQYGGYGQPPPQQSPYSPYAPQPYYGQQQQQQSPYGPPQQQPFSPGNQGPRTPFRLHESPGSRSQSQYDLSDLSTPQQSRGQGFSRHASREQLPVDPGSDQLLAQTRRLHTSVPAPAENDMAPQNISFIENSTDNDEDNDDKSSVSPDPDVNGSYQEPARTESNLTERLKRLNISRGDKTYRIQLHADGREPTQIDSDSSSRPSSRPTISSTFKERRRESGESSGPGSLSGPGSMNTPAVQTKLTDEEINTLNSMKTEVLKETGDPSKGFVISFDDDAPVKPKPVLRPKRLSSSSKKNSRDEKSDPVMIMLDMNEDADSDSVRDISPIRKMSPSRRMNSFTEQRDNRMSSSPSKYIDSSQWSNYGTDTSLRSPDDPVIPKFDVDPQVPLEPMAPLDNGASTAGSDSDSTRPSNTGMIIGDEVTTNNSDQSEMAKRKERIMLQSLRRQQQNEENRIKREEAARKRKEEAELKAEEAERKKEEEKKRKEAILEAYKHKKEQEKAEEEGRRFPEPVSAKPVPKIRPSPGGLRKPRPKTIHVDKNDVNLGARRIRGSSSNLRGSSSNLSNIGASNSDLRRSESRGSLADERPGSSRSTLSLANMGSRPPMGGQRSTPSYARTTAASSRRGSTQYLNEDAADSPRSSRMDRSGRSMSQPRGKRDSSVSSAYGAVDRGNRNDSFRGSRESLTSRRTYTARRGSNSSLYDEEEDYYYGGSLRDMNYGGHSGRRKSSSTNYLGPGSLPNRHRGDYDDGASDVSSQASGWSRYSYGGGQRLYREPQLKTNRPIVMNALEHAVFPGAVNKDVRNRVMDEIDACDCPHFLVLFRDSKCQFRGLYAYYPDTEEVFKIYGTGPKQVTDNMFDKYFKYNSGGKKFTQIHTKSLSVTIDAFTIQNSLWLGKKTKLPDRRGMPLNI